MKAPLIIASILIGLTQSVLAANESARAEARRSDAIVAQMSLEEKIDYIGGTGFGIRAMPRLGLPALSMSDGPQGVRSNAGEPSTVYVSSIGLAASWNTGLAKQVGAAIGRDARARNIHFMLGPGVNIARSPVNGRNAEYFGEDPFLAGEIAVGYIAGMQEQRVSATVKHFAANNSEFARHDTDSTIDERALREIYLPAFEAAVKKGEVGAVMDSYNLVNGAHATQNPFLNTTVLRNEWNFGGVLMSDWMATDDGVAAANSGLDIEMPAGTFMSRKTLLPAVADGRVSQETIDAKVRHILDTTPRFGWDEPNQGEAIPTYSPAAREIALQSAREAIVLLKNESVLPLDRAKCRTILVVGPNAHPAQVGVAGSGAAIPFSSVSVLEGIGKAANVGTKVFYERGLPTMAMLAMATEFTTDRAGTEPGLKLETFAGQDLTGTPVAVERVRHINVRGRSWVDLFAEDTLVGLPQDSVRHFVGKRWSGYYQAAESGRYTLAVEGILEGNGCRILVDGKPVIDQWQYATGLHQTAALDLAQGAHEVVVESYHSAPLGDKLRVAIVQEDRLVSARALELAAAVDAVVVATGFDRDSEAEAADRSFRLPVGQEALIRAMAKRNPRTIVTVTAGSGVDTRAWLDRVPAYLHLWYPGESGGTALAEILFGETNPSAKLPVSFDESLEDNPSTASYYPAPGTKRIDYREGVFVGYRGYEQSGKKPRFPFGFGLSYTSFKFDRLAVRALGSPDAPEFEVTFAVTNTGPRAGAAVAQVYVGEQKPTLPRPAKELKGFAKVELQPGETKTATVKLDLRSFAFFDVGAHAWRANAGRYDVHVGSSSAQIELSGTVALEKTISAKP